MRLDRRLADERGCGDLSVASAFQDQSVYLSLTGREPVVLHDLEDTVRQQSKELVSGNVYQRTIDGHPREQPTSANDYEARSASTNEPRARWNQFVPSGQYLV